MNRLCHSYSLLEAFKYVEDKLAIKLRFKFFCNTLGLLYKFFLRIHDLQKLGCNAELIVDEFGEKLLEELDYTLLCGSQVLVMEWIDGIRCTDPQAIKEAGIDVNGFLTVGVSAALRQLLEFGLFHGDPHPGNIFAMHDMDILIDAAVHAVNEDYAEMAYDFTRLGFLAPGTDVAPIIPALEAIWQNSAGKGLIFKICAFCAAGKFNQLVYNYPIRILERFSLVIHSLLTQEGICFTLKMDELKKMKNVMNGKHSNNLLSYIIFPLMEGLKIIGSRERNLVNDDININCIFQLIKLRIFQPPFKANHENYFLWKNLVVLLDRIQENAKKRLEDERVPKRDDKTN
ncbi:hypothetical protein UlMin_025459 [Ulmus minor]